MWKVLVPAALVLALLLALFAARRAAPPEHVGPVEVDGELRLRPCPSTPNCVSSQATAPDRRVEPFRLPGGLAPDAGFEHLLALVEARDDAEISERSVPGERPAWAHAIFVTSWMRFRDDVELLLDEDARVVHVRSASRVGHSDLGANRTRVEALRAALDERFRSFGR